MTDTASRREEREDGGARHVGAVAGDCSAEPETRAEEKEKEKEKQRQQRMVQALLGHVFLNVINLTLPQQTYPMVAGDLYEGDFAKGARFMGATATGAGRWDSTARTRLLTRFSTAGRTACATWSAFPPAKPALRAPSISCRNASVEMGADPTIDVDAAGFWNEVLKDGLTAGKPAGRRAPKRRPA